MLGSIDLRAAYQNDSAAPAGMNLLGHQFQIEIRHAAVIAEASRMNKSTH